MLEFINDNLVLSAIAWLSIAAIVTFLFGGAARNGRHDD